ncbi:hypothetical protein Ate02nite_81990 [Paractinoplanes tereljensis]|uniref:AAA ATPase-like protein n=2 Tax=Paractinoplanes tereljensis TaxID=571912 RepID=A0A919NX21_9ACTN|nr:hypothetical protein Ate02nite_81990 [Actinoplanes tereljensis]
MRAFLGRARELAAFRAALARQPSYTVLYLYGPGGIGKSTLLQRIADEIPAVFLEPGAEPGTEPAPLILIDGLDRLDRPAEWLREKVLPTGPVIVVAARQPPSAQWRADLGWNDILRPLPLGPLTPAESAALLHTHRVPADRHAAVLAFCCGNPLALRVAAQLVTGDRDATDDDICRDVAASIADQLLGDLPSPAHRQAVEAIAHAWRTNEELLRAALPGEDAATLFSWLRAQPFTAADARGVYPVDAVRNVVEADLRWRDENRFAAMHTRIKTHLIVRARTATGSAELPNAADVIFVQRHENRLWPYFTRLYGFEVTEHPYDPADRPQVLEMARAAEGPESAAIADFWLGRQPAAFRVYRRAGNLCAFGARLRLSRPDDDELAADPVVATAWARTQRVTPLRPGEHLNIARFNVEPAAYYRPSEAMDLMRLRLAATIMCEDGLAWSVILTPDLFWAPTIERSHTRDAGPPITVGGRDYFLFSQCFGAMPITAWSDVGVDLMMERRPRSVPRAASPWNRDDFDEAVQQALRCWRRTDELAETDLTHSRLALEAGNGDPVAGLRRVLEAALGTLRDDPRQQRYHRVLQVTYLDGVPSQQAAADRLHLPFSTYRRHRQRGLTALCDLLWKVETHGIGVLS